MKHRKASGSFSISESEMPITYVVSAIVVLAGLIFGGGFYLIANDINSAFLAGCLGATIVAPIAYFGIRFSGAPGTRKQPDAQPEVVLNLLPQFMKVAVLIAVVLFGFDFYSLQKAVSSVDWPTTSGRIIQSEVATGSYHDKYGRSHVVYRANIRYEYSVRGQNYTSSRISLAGWGNRSSAKQERYQALVNEYPVGKKVDVHYAEGHPNESVLQPGVVPLAVQSQGYMFASFAWFFFAIFWIVDSTRSKVSKPVSSAKALIMALNLIAAMLFFGSFITNTGPAILVKALVPKNALR